MARGTRRARRARLLVRTPHAVSCRAGNAVRAHRRSGLAVDQELKTMHAEMKEAKTKAKAKAAKAGAKAKAEAHDDGRVQSHCRFARLLIRFIPDSQRESFPLFLNDNEPQNTEP